MDRHDDIKKRLKAAGLSFQSLARDLGVAAPTVIIVSQGHRRSARIEGAIASALGVRPGELWPDRYPQPLRTY